MRQTSYRGF